MGSPNESQAAEHLDRVWPDTSPTDNDLAPTVMLLEVFRAGEGVDLIRESVKVAWRLAR